MAGVWAGVSRRVFVSQFGAGRRSRFPPDYWFGVGALPLARAVVSCLCLVSLSYLTSTALLN